MSLKTKIAVAVSLLFVLFIAAASYLAYTYFEHATKESITSQQFSLVSSLANNIDEKLSIAHSSLKAVAAIAPDDAFTNADKAQRFLNGTNGIHSIFATNAGFISLNGKIVAERKYVAGRRGKDLSYREWYKKTIESKKPFISDPFITTHPPIHPAVIMTVPMFDSRGNMKGMFIGSIDLLGENFLADLSKVSIGKTGYLYITDSNRIMIVHPDKNRIMKSAASLGVNTFYDKAAKGFEGNGETVTSYGIPMLSSAKRLRMTSWILLANYPVSEAYAPLRRAKLYFGIAFVVCTGTMLLITWSIVKHLMSPLALMTIHMEQLPKKNAEERLIKIQTTDEIGILATTFNSMMITLDRQHESMHEQTVMLEQEVAERQKTQEALEAKQQELAELNYSLEERVASSLNEIRKKDQMLIEQSRRAAMGEMINNIAHQWRQPLNNVGLIIQNIKMSFEMGQLTLDELTVENAKAMETILFMSRTIDDFRNFFHQDKQRIIFSVSDLLESTLTLVSASFRHLNISLDFEADDSVTAFGYPNEYCQVILNILNNAKDAFSERKVSAPLILIRAFGEAGRSVVTVGDNGGGIDEDILSRIFDPYFSTKEVGKGSGIGLYMSKVIIEQNMSGILIARNIDGGTEFRIELLSSVVTDDEQDPSSSVY